MNNLPPVEEQFNLGFILVLLASSSSLASLVLWRPQKGKSKRVRWDRVFFWVAVTLWGFVLWNVVPFAAALARH